MNSQRLYSPQPNFSQTQESVQYLSPKQSQFQQSNFTISTQQLQNLNSISSNNNLLSYQQYPEQLEQKQLIIKNYQNGVFHGEIDINTKEINGKGIFFWNEGEFYAGKWENNCQHGTGIFLFSNGAIYKGGFKQGKIDGLGELMYPDGSKQIGFWKAGNLYQTTEKFQEECQKSLNKEDMMVSDIIKNEISNVDQPYYFDYFLQEQIQIYSFDQNQIKIGQIDPFTGQIEGIGAIIDLIEQKITIGLFKLGQLSGRGRVIFKSGDIYDGFFSKGEFSGPGIYFNIVDKLSFYGYYNKNQVGEIFSQSNDYPPKTVLQIREESTVLLDENTLFKKTKQNNLIDTEISIRKIVLGSQEIQKCQSIQDDIMNNQKQKSFSQGIENITPIKNVPLSQTNSMSSNLNNEQQTQQDNKMTGESFSLQNSEDQRQQQPNEGQILLKQLQEQQQLLQQQQNKQLDLQQQQQQKEQPEQQQQSFNQNQGSFGNKSYKEVRRLSKQFQSQIQNFLGPSQVLESKENQNQAIKNFYNQYQQKRKSFLKPETPSNYGLYPNTQEYSINFPQSDRSKNLITQESNDYQVNKNNNNNNDNNDNNNNEGFYNVNTLLKEYNRLASPQQKLQTNFQRNGGGGSGNKPKHIKQKSLTSMQQYSQSTQIINPQKILSKQAKPLTLNNWTKSMSNIKPSINDFNSHFVSQKKQQQLLQQPSSTRHVRNYSSGSMAFNKNNLKTVKSRYMDYNLHSKNNKGSNGNNNNKKSQSKNQKPLWKGTNSFVPMLVAQNLQ